MKKDRRFLYGIGAFFLGCLALAALSADFDADSMTDNYEQFFGLNYTNAADAALDMDGDSLTNLQEAVLWTDPFIADTDRDGWADNIDSNPVSRAVFLWGDPQFTSNNLYRYTFPVWCSSGFKIDGIWTTNGWVADLSLSNNTGSLNIQVSRDLLTNNAVLDVELFDATNATLFVALCDSNQEMIVSNLYGQNLVGGSLETVTRRITIPFSSYSNACIVRLWCGEGAVTVYGSLMYIDSDGDGLDADQENQAGTSDFDADSDDDGLNDWTELMLTHTNPLNADTDGDGYSDDDERMAGSDPNRLSSLPVSEVSVFGTIHYSGVETGMIRIVADTFSNHWNSALYQEIADPGAYSLTQVPVLSNLWIRAWRDTDGNGLLEPWEARGEHELNPRYFTHSISNVDVTLTDYRQDYSMPFEETFEAIPEMAGAAGSLDEQHGWKVAGEGSALVQTNEVCGGSQAVAIENASVSHEFIGGKTNVWVSYRLTMARGGVPNTIPDNVAVAFFVNSAGHLCVYNGQESVVLPTIVPDGWNRFDFHCDYTTKRWDLRFNREQVVSGFEFYGTPSSFSLMRLDVNGSASSCMDDVHVLFENPDSDGDGLYIDEELAAGTSATNADSDGDGLSDGEELFQWSTNPLNIDTDGDGYNDSEEIRMGCDPNWVESQPVAYILPFDETFEDLPEMAGAVGSLAGQHGWKVAGEGSALVQTNEVCGGSQAVAIENASVSHEFIGGKTNVWVSYRLTMARGGAPKTIPDNVAVAFFVNSDGHLCVYNGRECVVMPTIVPDGWNRFDFHFDYTTRRWDLRFNREPVVSDFEFYGTPSSFSLMRLDVNGSASSFMDDIHVLFENPDSDGDGYSNEEEIQGGSNPESADSIPVSEASVSGTIIYEGAETGTIHVIAVTDSNAWDSSVNIQLVEPGAYSITVPVMTEVWIKAWVDSDGDGCRNVGEAQGAYGPVSLRWPKTGSDLTLSIPDSDNDGLSDAFELSGKIYQAIPGAFTWEEAEADAERLGGHLATITSEQEENILVQCVGYQAFYDNHLWLGASDIDGDGQWSWITGEPFDYTRWCDGSMASWAEGHPLAGANRAMMYHRWFTRSNNGQYWYDVGKNNRYGYLLEMTVTLDPHSNDTDGDGVSDFDEIRSGGNPTLVDTDGDGFTDGEEVAAGTSPAQLDTDFDGLTDVEELAGPTDPLNPDTDGDGLMDGPEVYGHIYYPVYEMLHWHGAKTHAESLGGHLATVTSEAEHKNIIRTLGTTVMNRYNFWLGASDEALEGDWCWVTGESFDYSRWYRTGSVMAPDNGSNLNLGMDEDYLEYFRGGIYQWNDINKSLWRPYIMEIDALLDPLNPDCDNDGIQDGDEIAKGMNPLSLDSDGDGLSDAYEIAHGLNGAIADSDFDGLNDGDEIALGTDPLNPDSDGDGLLDGEEHFITLTDPLSGMDAELSAFIPGVLGYNRELFHASNEYIEDGNDLIVASLIYNPSVTWTITNNTAGMYRLALQLDPYEKDEDEYFRYPVEVSINGNVIGEMLAVTNRGDLAEGFVYTPWLKPGIYEVKCRFKWFMQPATQDVRVHALELYPINGADSNQDGIQDWVQARLDSGMDSDGDGINDKDELFTLGTDLLKADTDGDGMTDHDEITLGTDPVERDTDGDGIDDWTEKNQALTDPLAADFGARTDEVSLNGSQITASVGNWIKEGSMIYSVGLNGSLTYVMNVPSAGHYAVEFEIADHSAFPESDPFDLTLAVDGTSGRSVAKPIPKGQLVSVLFFAPYLTAGEHSFNLLWSNLNSSQMLEVRNVRLVSYAGTDADGNGQSDWADTREANAFNLLETGFSSPVSPVCIEGSSLFVDLLSISNSFALTDVSNHWVHAQKSLEKGWYANAGLNPWDETEISFVHNGKSRPQSLALNWDETNLMNTPTNQVTVRLGDALLFNSMPTNENQGSIIITVNGPSGSTNLISLTDLPVPVLFDEPGTYTVSGFFSKSRAVSFNTNDPVNAYGFRNGHAANGVYNNGNTSTSSVFTVNVVDIHFNGNPSCVKDSERFWDCPDISTNAVIEQDAALAVQRYSLGDDGTRFWLYSSSEEEKCMIARLTANGPITAHALINTVTEAYGEFFRTVEEFADGSNLIELTLAYGNIPDDFRIVIEIFAGGITFLDGTVEKEFTKSDFNEQGVLKVLMVQSAGKVNDCHRVKIFQGDHQL